MSFHRVLNVGSNLIEGPHDRCPVDPCVDLDATPEPEPGVLQISLHDRQPEPRGGLCAEQPLGVPGEARLQVEGSHRCEEDDRPDRARHHQLEESEPPPLSSG